MQEKQREKSSVLGAFFETGRCDLYKKWQD